MVSHRSGCICRSRPPLTSRTPGLGVMDAAIDATNGAAFLETDNNTAPATVDLERLIQAFENKCYRRTLGASYRENKTNDCVSLQVNVLAARPDTSSVGSSKLSCSAMSTVKIRCRKSYNTEQYMVDVPVIVVGVAHRSRQKSMGIHCGGGVCPSTTTTPGN